LIVTVEYKDGTTNVMQADDWEVSYDDGVLILQGLVTDKSLDGFRTMRVIPLSDNNVRHFDVSEKSQEG
jgi:hypothetical protein